MKSAYKVRINNETIIVVAENIAGACDILSKNGFTEYRFINSKSIPVLLE